MKCNNYDECNNKNIQKIHDDERDRCREIELIASDFVREGKHPQDAVVLAGKILQEHTMKRDYETKFTINGHTFEKNIFCNVGQVKKELMKDIEDQIDESLDIQELNRPNLNQTIGVGYEYLSSS